MKNYFFPVILLLIVFSSCQHYTSNLPPNTVVTGIWTFQKDTVTVTNGTTVTHQYINNINPGSTLQFDNNSFDGRINYVASPDTTLDFTYSIINYGATLSLAYPGQTVFGVYRPGQTVQYTFIKTTAHSLILNYTYTFFDSENTQGEIYANYYWTK